MQAEIISNNLISALLERRFCVIIEINKIYATIKRI